MATTKTFWNVASSLMARPGGDTVARPMILCGLDAARRLRQDAPGAVDGWKRAGLLEQLREPIRSGAPTPRFRLPFDPVFDLSAVRATWALRQTLAVQPRDDMSLLSLGRSFGSRGMDESALPLIELFSQQPIRNESHQAYRALAADQILKIRAALGPRPATTWANLGELDRVVAALLARGWSASAADVMEDAYKPEVRSWAWADRLAVLRLHLGEPARARATWLAVREPVSPALRSARVGHTYLVEDDRESARRSYHDAIAADPQLFEAHYALAILEQDDGRLAEARAALRQAEATAPNDHSRDAVQLLARTTIPPAAAP